MVQNERFDDWFPTLQQLKMIFANYKKSIIDYHKTADDSEPIPEAVISSAAQGNFLEVLNMSLNTFEHHYLNRNLDRTGQQSIVITPGKTNAQLGIPRFLRIFNFRDVTTLNSDK